ncbi:MAG: phosphohistidine phosphatase SixA [Pirellulales bacterium]
MLLYIVRHAWAFERDAEQFPDDRLRPLTPEGTKRFRRVVRRLVRRGVRPSVIATSPLVRCRQTADLLAAQLDDEVPLEEIDALAPGSDLEAALDWTKGQLQRRDDAREMQVAWVGHSPDVEELAARLIGDRGAAIRFAKGAVAAIRFADEPAVAAGRLDWLVTARILGQ